MTKESIDERDKKRPDLQLDSELVDTFPASDPLTITRFPRERRRAEKPRMRSDAAGAPSDSSCKTRQTTRVVPEVPPRGPLSRRLV
jgi:hypothetical protein